MIALLMAFFSSYTDRIGFWTLDGDAMRWVGVVVCFGGLLRIVPVYVLRNRFSGLVAIQPGHRLETRGIYGVIRKASLQERGEADFGELLVQRAGASPRARKNVGRAAEETGGNESVVGYGLGGDVVPFLPSKVHSDDPNCPNCHATGVCPACDGAGRCAVVLDAGVEQVKGLGRLARRHRRSDFRDKGASRSGAVFAC